MLRDLPDNFQLDHIQAAMAFVGSFNMAIDIGAHRGIYTKAMLERFEKVVAIEPTDLAEKIDPRAFIIKAAMGSRSGYCSMHPGPRNNGQTHVIQGKDTIVLPLDQYGFEPDFIKIDVEGMEFDVLRGAKNTILTHRPVIMIEENGLCKRYGHRLDRASGLLLRWGAQRVATFYSPPEKDRNVVFKFPCH